MAAAVRLGTGARIPQCVTLLCPALLASPLALAETGQLTVVLFPSGRGKHSWTKQSKSGNY